MGKYEDRTDAIVRNGSRTETAERRIGPAGRGFGRCGAGLLLLLVVTGFASAAAAVSQGNGGVPDPSAPTLPAGYRENACSPQQIEGGYEDLGGRCQLTGWNWVLPDGTCYASRGAENGRLPAAGDTSACRPTGCVSSICGDNIAPWLGAGQTTPPETCVESASDPADRAIFPKEFLRNLTAG